MMNTLYGIHPVLEALKKRPLKFHQLFLARHSGGDTRKQIVDLANKANIKISYLSSDRLSRHCRSADHQGVVADVEPLSLTNIETLLMRCKEQQQRTFLLVLDSIQDPRNFGSLIRSAYCSGAQAVIFPKDRAVSLTASVAKASSGAVEHIPLCRVVNLASTLERLKKQGIWIIGTSPQAPKCLYEGDYDLDLAIIIGSEAKGLRPLIMKKCDYCVSIPMQGILDSLNAAVSGAVVLFEIMRQRFYEK